MFHYQGSRTDKHVREHEVYAIGYPGDFTSTQRSLSKQSRYAGATGFNAILFKVENYWDMFVAAMARWERRAIEVYHNASRKQRAGMVAGVAIVLLTSLVALTVKLVNRPVSKPVAAIAPQQPQIAKAEPERSLPATSSKPAAENKAPQRSETKLKNPPEAKTAKNESKKSRKADVPEKKVQGVNQSARVRTLVETTGAPALVSMVITPWGEISLDGRIQGVSPPLLELQVVEGKHVIKISNTTFPPVTQTITVKAGERIKIKHKFADK
jgi:hypothetical protein